MIARQLYTLLFLLLLPFILLRLWWRGLQAPAYRQRWRERLGMVPKSIFSQQPLWIHAVSVGEVIAAAPLVEKFLHTHPQLPVVLTTMTPTGASRVQALFGERVCHLYAPYDLPFCVNGFLKRTSPRLLVIMETELWPNWIFCCRQRAIPSVLANGRLSEKSARGYQHFARLVKPMLQNISWLAVQDGEHAQRFIGLGAPEESVSVLGNIKFDMQMAPNLNESAKQLRQQWGVGRLVIVAGSTHEGEEDRLLDAFREVSGAVHHPLLVVVPRHPERFADVDKLLIQQGWTFSRWSDAKDNLQECEVLLVDAMGELMRFYAAADIAFVGGSLIKRGGHNPLEPAAHAIPIVMGSSVFNFQDICSSLQQLGSLRLVTSTELADELVNLAINEPLRQQRGQAGRIFVNANKGTMTSLYNGIVKWLDKKVA